MRLIRDGYIRTTETENGNLYETLVTDEVFEEERKHPKKNVRFKSHYYLWYEEKDE